MATLNASSTGSNISADFTLIDGQSAMLFLTDVEGDNVDPVAVAYIQIKSGTQYFNIGVLDVTYPARVLQAAGTFRVKKMSAPVAFGVDKE